MENIKVQNFGRKTSTAQTSKAWRSEIETDHIYWAIRMRTGFI